MTAGHAERSRGPVHPTVRYLPGPDLRAWLSGPNGAELMLEFMHDLRSPLASIVCLADHMQLGTTGAVNPIQRRQLGAIYSAAMALSQASEGMMELLRTRQGQIAESPIPFLIQDVVEDVRNTVRPMVEEKDLELRIALKAQGRRLGRPRTLNRVLLNLVTNALKFTERGYVELAVRPAAGARVEFAVRDTGPGIDPGRLTTLYHPFPETVTEHGARRNFSRSGLGLALCRRLVTTMGGQLLVETEPQWGTRFLFRLDLPVVSDLIGRGWRGDQERG